MRISKILAVSLLSFVVSACTCTPHKGPDAAAGSGAGDNISSGNEEGPLKPIYFAFDSFALDATAKSTLKGNADWLAANSGAKVQVEGHCDERGTNQYNMSLGQNRANAAQEYLRSLGVAPSRIGTVSYGEELPADPSHTEQAWARNRRDVFKVQR